MRRPLSPLAAGLGEFAGAAWQLWSFLRDDPEAARRPPGGPRYRPSGRASRPAVVLLVLVGGAATLAALTLG